jgi:hypothetical protein
MLKKYNVNKKNYFININLTLLIDFLNYLMTFHLMITFY